MVFLSEMHDVRVLAVDDLVHPKTPHHCNLQSCLHWLLESTLQKSEVRRDINVLMTTLKQIKEKAHKDDQKKNGEAISWISLDLVERFMMVQEQIPSLKVTRFSRRMKKRR